MNSEDHTYDMNIQKNVPFSLIVKKKRIPLTP
uniref:Uncharacterized protein n=1 Tax=Arundo donax TaxID=35708 RepID=A0A0A9GZ85_ARUDO